MSSRLRITPFLAWTRSTRRRSLWWSEHTSITGSPSSRGGRISPASVVAPGCGGSSGRHDPSGPMSSSSRFARGPTRISAWPAFAATSLPSTRRSMICTDPSTGLTRRPSARPSPRTASTARWPASHSTSEVFASVSSRSGTAESSSGSVETSQISVRSVPDGAISTASQWACGEYRTATAGPDIGMSTRRASPRTPLTRGACIATGSPSGSAPTLSSRRMKASADPSGAMSGAVVCLTTAGYR